MENVFSQVFLYIACIYAINTAFIRLFRRLKLADFIAHILTGVVFSLLLVGWAELFGPGTVQPFQDTFKITGHSVEKMQTGTVPDTVVKQLESQTNQIFIGEQVFLDSLAAYIGADELEVYKTKILKFAAFNEGFLPVFILFLAQIGLLLFAMQLGFNFDFKLFRLKENNILLQSGAVFLLTVAVLGASSYFLLFDRQFWPTVFLAIAFLSINIGAVLTSNFPMTPSLKKPLSNLVQLAVILDFLAILLFAGLSLFFEYEKFDGSDFNFIAILWVLILLYILPVAWPKTVENFFDAIKPVAGEYSFLLKAALFFFFLYLGFRLDISVLVLGFWGGLIFKSFAGKAHYEMSQKFFTAASFVYIFPFVEIGRDLFLPAEYALIFWYHLCVMLLALVVISLLMGLLVVRKKEYPLIMSLGAFPRGELAVLILWLFKTIHFLPSSIFIIAVIVVIVTSLLGSLLGRLLFIHPIERQKRLSYR